VHYRASKIAGSWRISNDIQNNWRSIWRITNEVAPYFKWTGPGAYPDMDMLMWVHLSFKSLTSGSYRIPEVTYPGLLYRLTTTTESD